MGSTLMSYIKGLYRVMVIIAITFTESYCFQGDFKVIDTKFLS